MSYQTCRILPSNEDYKQKLSQEWINKAADLRRALGAVFGLGSWLLTAPVLVCNSAAVEFY